MNNKKLNTIIYIVVFVFIFIMFVLTTYSYYKKVIKDNSNVIETNSFNMLVMFNDTNNFNARNLKKGYEVTKEFTIENFSNDTIGKYDIYFDIVTPLSNMVDEGFVYTLEGSSDSKDTTNKVASINPTPVPVLSKKIATSTITPKNTHNYKLTIKLNNNKYIKNSLFNANIKITASSKEESNVNN